MIAELFPDVGDLVYFSVLLACFIEDGLGVADEDEVVVVGEVVGEEVGGGGGG